MNKFAKIAALTLAAASVCAAFAIAGCGPTEPEGPQTVEAEQISSCKVEYNWGEVFD